MGSIVGLQPAWLLFSLPLGARAGSLLGLGELLGLLLAVPVASVIKTLLDALYPQISTEPLEEQGKLEIVDSTSS
jgi:predicted PurR-regulated permease PerM